MPFINQTPRPFTQQNIETLTANQIGVYGIYNRSQWIYIGKGDIRERLLSHVSGDNPCINRNQPTSWVAEITNGDPSRREKELILEYNPVCNKRVG